MNSIVGYIIAGCMLYLVLALMVYNIRVLLYFSNQRKDGCKEVYLYSYDKRALIETSIIFPIYVVVLLINLLFSEKAILGLFNKKYK